MPTYSDPYWSYAAQLTYYATTANSTTYVSNSPAPSWWVDDTEVSPAPDMPAWDSREVREALLRTLGPVFTQGIVRGVAEIAYRPSYFPATRLYQSWLLILSSRDGTACGWSTIPVTDPVPRLGSHWRLRR